MRIGIDARLYGPAKNKGLGRYVEQLVKNLELIDKENEYFILLRRTPSFDGAGNWDEYEPRNLRFKKIECNYRWYSFAEQILLPIKLWRLNCDLVHFPHFNVPLFCPCKFVVTIHDLIMYKFPDERATTRHQWLYKIKYWLHKLVVKSAIKRAEQVIVPSEWTKRDIVDEFRIDSGKIVVTHLGFEIGKEIEKLEIKKLRDDETTTDVFQKYNIRKPYLLYVGSAYPHKNLERLVRAFKLVRPVFAKASPFANTPAFVKTSADRSAGENLQLVLVGKNDYFYKKLTAYSLQLTAGIIFTGHVSSSELGALYQNAEAYIFPSLYEGFGLPGLEAMSYGIPVVSSNGSCLPEIYGKAALYFVPTDKNDMYKKIVQILEDENLRQQLVNKGFEQIKKYSWRRCIEETWETYAHLPQS